jgi:hypothetical protein
MYKLHSTKHKKSPYVIIPCCFRTFFIEDFFIVMLLRTLVEDDCPAFMLGALLVDRPARALLLHTFLAATRTRPHPRPSPASSSVLLGDSPLTGEASRPDLVCIAGKQSLVRRSGREAGNRRRTCNARVRMTGNHRNHCEAWEARCTYSQLRAHAALYLRRVGNAGVVAEKARRA